ncbi:MAG: L,D-transpeptidase family protein [Rhizobiales bacterium]|nr:L,D-transpeptidase family protein [Hyphomicrobiales bacterium]
MKHGIVTQTHPMVCVRSRPGRHAQGWLTAGSARIAVTLGRMGILANKREGDGATPRGTFRPIRLWWRADRLPRPRTRLPLRPIRPHDAWCEDPGDRRYNRPIRMRPGAAGDRLWRDDHLYDLIVEIDHNARPRIPGRGSAVFLHVARSDRGPTAGCVAADTRPLLRLLAKMSPKTRIIVRF